MKTARVLILMVALAIISAIAFVVLPSRTGPRNDGNPRSELRILVVSDIHNNLAAVSWVKGLVVKHKVDIVLDAGDLTDFGTSSETDVVDAFEGIAAPHVFVAGNHDSRVIGDRLAGQKNVYFPDEREIEVDGVHIIGQDDPASRIAAPHSVDPSPADLRRSIDRLKQAMANLSTRPDIIMAHEPAIAERFAGRASLIITGHLHRASVKRISGSVIVNPGTTGAAGLRYSTKDHGDKMTAALIEVSTAPRFAVVYVQMITKRPGTD